MLNKHLPRGRAILVGGALVEFYTGGAYVTADVDLVGDRPVIAAVLEPAGFEASGRYFFHEQFELAVEVPGLVLRPTETVVEFDFEGYRVPCVSVEDSIVDRLLAAEYWKSATDWEQALLLYGAHRDSIRLEVLRDKARRNEVERKLEQMLSLLD